MAWSTRQVAELAGTTVKAVRHYHKLGLLEEPERGANGYKHYGVPHLVRLLRIRRLTDLGVSLSQVAAMDDADEHPREMLRMLDAELAGTIDRLQRIRAEVSLVLQQSLPTDLPPALAAVASDLSESDRAMTVVYTRVANPDGVQVMQDLLADTGGRYSPSEQFDNLPPDADDTTRQRLVEQLVPQMVEMIDRLPRASLDKEGAPEGKAHAARTLKEAMADIYNPAQVDVLERASRQFRGRAGGDTGEPAGQ